MKTVAFILLITGLNIQLYAFDGPAVYASSDCSNDERLAFRQEFKNLNPEECNRLCIIRNKNSTLKKLETHLSTYKPTACKNINHDYQEAFAAYKYQYEALQCPSGNGKSEEKTNR